jgi:hypothetical protein
MVVSGMALGQHNLDTAAVKDRATRFIFSTPSGKGTPAKRIAVKRYRPIEVRWGNEQMIEPILWHCVEPRPLTNQANRRDDTRAAGLPRSVRVEREVRRHWNA